MSINHCRPRARPLDKSTRFPSLFPTQSNILNSSLRWAFQASVQAIRSIRRPRSLNSRSLSELSVVRSMMFMVTSYHLDLNTLRGKAGARGLLRRRGEYLSDSLAVQPPCSFVLDNQLTILVIEVMTSLRTPSSTVLPLPPWSPPYRTAPS